MNFFQKSNRVKRRGDTEFECKNKCETQFKIQNTFSKIKFYLLEKKEVNKKESKKKTSGHFNTKGFFGSKKLKNTKLEMKKETKKKKHVFEK